MPLSPAPLFTDVCPGPAGGVAHWIGTSDDLRIRVAHWPLDGARGTVLLFPGRTEYVEKYGLCAADLAARGLATMTIDWRGQGLSDRMLDDRRIGHIDDFTDYQRDVSAMVRAARELGLPRPFFLLAHSMGGCIGLRAVMQGLAVQAAAFTGPMWGIHIAPHMRLLASVMTQVMPRLGQGHRIPPGTTLESYVTSEPFEDNMLTTDAQQFDMMRDQISAHPELALGGPSVTWLGEALEETRHLAGRAAPSLPCITWVGSNERIVDVPRIHARMESWKGGQLHVVDGAEHEVLMETDNTRRTVMDELQNLFLSTVTR